MTAPFGWGQAVGGAQAAQEDGANGHAACHRASLRLLTRPAHQPRYDFQAYLVWPPSTAGTVAAYEHHAPFGAMRIFMVLASRSRSKAAGAPSMLAICEVRSATCSAPSASRGITSANSLGRWSLRG